MVLYFVKKSTMANNFLFKLFMSFQQVPILLESPGPSGRNRDNDYMNRFCDIKVSIEREHFYQFEVRKAINQVNSIFSSRINLELFVETTISSPLAKPLAGQEDGFLYNGPYICYDNRLLNVLASLPFSATYMCL